MLLGEADDARKSWSSSRDRLFILLGYVAVRLLLFSLILFAIIGNSVSPFQ